MSIQFTDPNHVERYKEVINNDPEFKLASKFMSENIRFVMGDYECILKVVDGVLTKIKLENTFLDAWNFSVSASMEAWQKLLQPVPPPKHNDIFAAMTQGLFRMEGDLEAAFAYYWALQRMVDVIREVQNQ